jgi:putative spermidine/putrescine transport system ATP-binding protein
VILLRPERLSLAAAAALPAEGCNGLAGRVSEAIYLGSGSKYQVALRDGSVAVVRTPPEASPFAIGDEVSLSWPIAACKLLADDDRAELTLT